MNHTPAAAFLSGHAPKELTPESSPTEMLELLASLNWQGEDKVLALVHATDVLDACLQDPSPQSTFPDITPLLLLAENLFSEGHNRLVQSFYSVLAQIARSKFINDISSDTILRIVNMLSLFAGKLAPDECLRLLSFYLDTPDKAIFSLGVQIVEKSHGVGHIILTPCSVSDQALASMLSAGSFIHQVNLAPYLSAACKFPSVLMHIDRLSLCYSMYERCLKAAYGFILNKLTLSVSSAARDIPADEHAACVLDVLFPHLFCPHISTLQLEFLSDIFAIATQHAQSDTIYNILVDIVAELRGLADLYDGESFLKRVDALRKANPTTAQLPLEPLLFVTHISTSCRADGGMFRVILMRLSACIYKMEILLCRRNASVKYNAIVQTHLTQYINGKPMSECKDLLEAAQAMDASQEIRLYVNMRETQKTPLRKS